MGSADRDNPASEPNEKHNSVNAVRVKWAQQEKGLRALLRCGNQTNLLKSGGIWATRAREASRIGGMATTMAATAGSTGSTMRAVQAILAAGFVCGTLDAISARIVSGAPWIRISQFIASGVLGPDSFKGGVRTALLGTALHYAIAFGATIIFFMAIRFMPMLLDRPLLFGPLYGVCVHLFMQLVVLPMSAIGRRPHSLQGFLIQLVVHMVVVGPSIALTLWAVLRRA